MRKISYQFLLEVILIGFLVTFPLHSAIAGGNTSSLEQEGLPTVTLEASLPTPAEIINAVNTLRLSNALHPLAVHAALMQVAADQANALAATGGMIGHERPCGMTLGQDLLSRGYPLLGDLSMDGYRSENWVAAPSAEAAVQIWLGDFLHANTMLSPDRSDIGAAVAMGDQIYLVIETALSTGSGLMQHDAYPILTGIPMTQAACVGMITQAASYGLSSQDILPVTRNTAMPDGVVMHEVRYGQTLWTLAMQYDSTIAEIKSLNHLSSDVISPGQKLIVKTGATQPAHEAITNTPSLTATRTVATAVVQPSAFPGTATATVPQEGNPPPARSNRILILALVVGSSLLLAGLGAMGSKKTGA